MSSDQSDLGYATIDLQRQVRCGFPEVVLAEGKTCEWLLGAIAAIQEARQDCLATRLSDEQAGAASKQFPTASQDRLARTFLLRAGPARETAGKVVVVTAGTSDLAVAKEAEITAQA